MNKLAQEFTIREMEEVSAGRARILQDLLRQRTDALRAIQALPLDETHRAPAIARNAMKAGRRG